jgi:hypothetical protein
MPPVTGTVTNQAAIMFRNNDQSTDCLARIRPVNTTEPTLQWVVETGILSNDANSTVIALAISITKPLNCENLKKNKINQSLFY